jgi:beta-lactam-binding protein with PASTA domain
MENTPNARRITDDDPDRTTTTCTVPEVVGMSAGEARAAIKDARLNSNIQGRGDVVKHQTPAANTDVPCGSEVKCVLGS